MKTAHKTKSSKVVVKHKRKIAHRLILFLMQYFQTNSLLLAAQTTTAGCRCRLFCLSRSTAFPPLSLTPLTAPARPDTSGSCYLVVSKKKKKKVEKVTLTSFLSA